MTLPCEQLRVAYRLMRMMREFDERMRKEFAAGRLPGFIHLYCGQEAIAAGVCMHLDERDYIGSTHRGHGHCIAKGCNVHDMALEIYCRDAGLCRGKGGSMHIADLSKGMLGANAIVGGSAPLAMGAALSAKTLLSDRVAVAFVGDGASNQGAVFESMNLAVVLRLPALFVFENNGYAEMTGVSYHCGSGDIAARAGAFGMPSEKVDGTDFFAVYEAAGKAVARARAGDGPSSIECVAPRLYGHYEGDPQSYRATNEVKILRETQDPLAIFRAYVTARGLLEESDLALIDRSVADEIDAAVRTAEIARIPDINELYNGVYASYV